MPMVIGPANIRVHPPQMREDAGGGRAWPPILQKIAYVLVLAATFFVYLPAIAYQFVYDDLYQIVLNPHVHSWRFLPIYFTQSVWSHLGNTDTNLYRPLFLLWLRVNMALFGEQPAAWHLTTLAAHIAATALVYLVARRIFRGYTAALLAAAVFGLHPIHVEGVAWVSGVPEPLGAALFMGALLCYFRQREQRNCGGVWLAGSLFLFAAGMLVKETVATLPLVIAAYELTLGRRNDQGTGQDCETAPTVWGALVVYAVVLVLYLAVRRLAMGPLHHGEVALGVSLLSWPWLLWTYVRMLVWPASLSPSYDFPYVHHLGDPRFLAAFAIAALGAAGLWFWYRSRRSPWAVFLIFWFLITLAPAFAAFCLAYAEESYHDRYLYLPSVAFALLAGALLAKLCEAQERLRRMAGWGLAVVILLAMGLATHRQLAYWESNYALFQRANAMAPHNARAAVNFSGELMRHQQYRRALTVAEQVISYHPDSERLLENAGFSSLALGDYPVAENYYVRAAQLSPQEGKLFYFLGLARLRQKHYERAAEALRTAVGLSPQQVFYHYLLGTALAELGEWQAAKEQYAAEIRLNQKASLDLARQGLVQADSRIRNPRP